ncbi:hypothetical protein BGX26_007232 [Mortierella sp. AD094]|nr:hypothetical protein BGX26_007232 [Mortierella sp. AD094]
MLNPPKPPPSPCALPHTETLKIQQSKYQRQPIESQEESCDDLQKLSSKDDSRGGLSMPGRLYITRSIYGDELTRQDDDLGFDTNTDKTNSTVPPLAIDNNYTHTYKREVEKTSRNEQQHASTTPINHRFPPGAFYTPSCSRIAASTSSLNSLLGVDDVGIENEAQLAVLLSNSDDLPSPIYNHDSSDEEDEENSDRNRRVRRAVFAGIAPSLSSGSLLRTDIISKDNDLLVVPESVVMEGEDKSEILVNTPLLILQERGYASVEGTTESRIFEEHKRELSVITQFDMDLGCVNQETTNSSTETPLVLMSATIDLKYWELSSPVEDFEVVNHPAIMETPGKVDLDAIVHVQDGDEHQEISRNYQTQLPHDILCYKDLVTIELKAMEYQIEREVEVIAETLLHGEGDEENVIYIDYDRLLCMCAEEGEEHEREKEHSIRLRREAGLESDFSSRSWTSEGVNMDSAHSRIIDIDDS